MPANGNTGNGGTRSGFDVLDVAVELVAVMRSVLEILATRDGALAGQLRRALPSIAMNISEGNRRRGKDRLHLWRVAAGSAAEVKTGLLVALNMGYVAEDDIVEPLALLDRDLAMLWKLTS